MIIAELFFIYDAMNESQFKRLTAQYTISDS